MRTLLALGMMLPLAAQTPPQPRIPHHATGWPGPVLDNHITNLSRTVAGRPMIGRPGAPSIPVFFGVQPWVQPVYAPPVLPAAPPVVIVHQQQAPPAFVTVNRDYKPESPKPVMTEYSNTSKPYENFQPGASKVFLIALQDGTLRQALAFWREDDTLFLVQPDRKQTGLKMAEIDLAATRRFNAERGIEIRIQ